MAKRVTVREQHLEPAASLAKGTAYRPINRPPMALLIALDDGSAHSGETWRIRGNRHVIGRKKGETVIAHDPGISGEHAAITCELKDGKYVWHLTDLKSTNGTFFRVRKGALNDRFQVLLGSRRYDFNASSGGAADGTRGGVDDDELMATRLCVASRSPMSKDGPCLVECVDNRQGNVFPIKDGTASIGSDCKICQIAILDDPLVCPRHASIRKNSQGQWAIYDNHSVNGVWIRVDRVRLTSDSEFQLGEQRFLLQLLPGKEADRDGSTK